MKNPYANEMLAFYGLKKAQITLETLITIEQGDRSENNFSFSVDLLPGASPGVHSQVRGGLHKKPDRIPRHSGPSGVWRALGFCSLWGCYDNPRPYGAV